MSRPIVVLKIGTSSIVATSPGEVGVVQLSQLARLSEATVKLFSLGFGVVIVSSGAVGLGCARLGLRDRPTTVAGKQAAAAIGQVRLMTLYSDMFGVLGRPCAQVLLTYDSFGDRTQYMNARNTLLELLQMGVVPVINENDSVATQELRVGDNDSLSAHVAAMIGATWLFLLTDVDSLYEANPKTDPTAAAIRIVPTHAIQQLRRQMHEGSPRITVSPAPVALLEKEAPGSPSPRGDAARCSAAPASPGAQGAAGSQWGTGGMQTKLKAAQLATAAGVTVVIMNTQSVEGIATTLDVAAGAAHPAVLSFSDKAIGTTFLPAPRPVTGRKRWILSLVPQGQVFLDAGAVLAVGEQRKSLFPAGIVSLTGDFEAQDAVLLLSEDGGREVGRALVNYGSAELRKILGRHSRDLCEILGYIGAEAAADRDNICVLAHAPSLPVEEAAVVSPPPAETV